MHLYELNHKCLPTQVDYRLYKLISTQFILTLYHTNNIASLLISLYNFVSTTFIPSYYFISTTFIPLYYFISTTFIFLYHFISTTFSSLYHFISTIFSSVYHWLHLNHIQLCVPLASSQTHLSLYYFISTKLLILTKCVCTNYYKQFLLLIQFLDCVTKLFGYDYSTV